ncbi:MAG TPA: hypothetical protein VK970_02765, partial [Candidatus Methylacidiphilales bacterium]|nr:hypothetical protein [Candidatus Methylacidiphilales bacterium]
MRNLASRLGNYLLGAGRNETTSHYSPSPWASVVSDAHGIAGNLRDLIFPPLELEGEMPVRMRAPLCEQCGAFIPTRAEPPAAPDATDAERAAESPEEDSDVPSPEDPYRPLCNNCREHLAVHGAYSYQWARAAYRSDGQVRDAIHRFKYG